MRILLAIDHSECSEATVEAVIAQFRRDRCEVQVFHAVDWERNLPLSSMFAEGPAAAQDVLAERDRLCVAGRALVEQAAARLHAAGFTASATALPEGEARGAILEAATDWRADLIVVGSHGRTGLDRFLLGSVAESIVRRARCSVQVVRRPAPVSA